MNNTKYEKLGVRPRKIYNKQRKTREKKHSKKGNYLPREKLHLKIREYKEGREKTRRKRNVKGVMQL